MKRIAVLAVQGAFAEHETVFRALGCETCRIRRPDDLGRAFDALVLPGGESTTQGKLLRELGLFAPLRERIAAGLPVLATCAGIILLAEKLTGGASPHFATLPVTVERNAYGRQTASFHTVGEFAGESGVPMPFIRAPRIVAAAPEVATLSRVRGTPAAVRYGGQLALTFHPEITADRRIHEFFLREIVG